MKKLLAAFLKVRNISVDADSLRMWIDALSDLPPEAFELALRRFNRESTDYPTPAAVRRFAGAAGLTDQQRAITAWQSVRSSVLKYGAYYAIEFDDPIIHAAIRGIGGWVNLCNTPHDEMQWKQRAFCEQYLSVCSSGVGDLRPLSGLLDHQPQQQITTGLLPHYGVKALIDHRTSQREALRIPDMRAERV